MELGSFFLIQNQWGWVEMVKEDAVEGLVDSIIDVIQKVLLVGSSIGRSLGKYIDSQCVGCGNEVSARFGDQFSIGESLIQQGTNSIGDSSEGDRGILIISGPSSSEIELGEVESVLLGHVEKVSGRSNSGDEGLDRHAARSNVERYSNKIELQFLGNGEDLVPLIAGCSKLGRESADRVGIVCDDSEQKLGFGVALGDLSEFVGIVEGHHLNPGVLGILDVGHHLGWVRINDSMGSNSRSQDLLDLGLGSAVKVDSKGSQSFNNGCVGVAFNGIEGLDSREESNPLFVLLNNSLEVHDVEGLVFEINFVADLSSDDVGDF